METLWRDTTLLTLSTSPTTTEKACPFTTRGLSLHPRSPRHHWPVFQAVKVEARSTPPGPDRLEFRYPALPLPLSYQAFLSCYFLPYEMGTLSKSDIWLDLW